MFCKHKDKKSFLFPCDYFHKRQPDPVFAAQATALQATGHAVHSFDADAFGGFWPALTGPVLYRGYMLDAEGYQALEQAVAAAGGRLQIPSATYLLCHHLPNWYPLLTDLTPETLIFPDTDAALAAIATLNWPGFFLKDYVKSLKTGPGSVAHSADEAATILQEMENYRGRIEGGICVRRLVLQPHLVG